MDPADNHFDDWFELYNPNNTAVDLTGYALSDTLTNASARWTVPFGTSIAPRSFLLVWADNDLGQNVPGSPDLHAPFKLSVSGEAIALFAPNGKLVDSVIFGPQTNDLSQGRWPNGDAQLYFMLTPTPRTSNVIPNPPAAEIRIDVAGMAFNGDFFVQWNSEPGQTYRVESKTDLNISIWSTLREETATGSQTAVTNSSAGVPQRFYRIQRLTP